MTTKVITGKDTRFSYLNANEPKAINGGKPKYSVSLIISKDDVQTIDKLHHQDVPSRHHEVEFSKLLGMEQIFRSLLV